MQIKKPLNKIIECVAIKSIISLIACILLMNIFEILGLSLFIPVIEYFQPSATVSSVTSKLSVALIKLGLEPSLGLFLILLSTIFVIKSSLMMYMRHYSVSLSANLQYILRSRLFVSYLHANTGFIYQQRQGALLSALGEHTIKTGQAFFVFIQVIATWIAVIAYMLFVFWLSWKLTLLVIVLGAFMAPIFKWIGRQAHHHGKMYTQALEESQHLALEAIQSKKVVNAMNWSSPISKKFAVVSQSVHQHWAKSALWSNSPGIIAQPIAIVILCGIIWFSVKLNFSVSILGGFALAFIRLLPNVQSAVSMGADLQACLPSISRVFELIEQSELNVERSGSMPFNGFKHGITLKNINFGYQEKLVLEQLSLTIPKGKTIALVGPSGAGKTTIVDLIMGLYPLKEGIILIDDVALDKLSVKAFREKIAYVPQEPIFFHDTIRANLLLGLAVKVDDNMLINACEKVGAWSFVSERPEQLNTIVGDRGVQLSGGQRQRLALARALLRRPEILILDEATSALDQESESWIREALINIQRTGDVTVVIIAHRYKTIEHADEIIEVRDGRALPLGNWEQASKSIARSEQV
jgi:ATP-binding cassette, subfamily B, bacterial MsbA